MAICQEQGANDKHSEFSAQTRPGFSTPLGINISNFMSTQPT